MPTIDGGFRTGDKVTPNHFNTHAQQGVVCVVVAEDGRYGIKVEFPDGRQEWTSPYRWGKAPVVATTPNAGEQSLYRWQYRQTSGFEAPLWECISTADSTNLNALAKGFPEHVAAYRRYASEHGYWPNLVAKIEGRV